MQEYVRLGFQGLQKDEKSGKPGILVRQGLQERQENRDAGIRVILGFQGLQKDKKSGKPSIHAVCSIRIRPIRIKEAPVLKIFGKIRDSKLIQY